MQAEQFAESAESPKDEVQDENAEWTKILPSVVKIDSYDGKRILESGQGFFDYPERFEIDGTGQGFFLLRQQIPSFFRE